MRAVMVMYDSLNRHYLPPYNPDTNTHAPNFQRLAQRTLKFTKSYVCSMPCMPARRDLHSARPGFLHCGWGPLEPFDDSVPAMLSEAGVYTHLVSDHYHYWEDGGSTYHGRYDSWECVRGQEADSFIGQVAEPEVPLNHNGKGRRTDWVNRQFITRDEQYPQSQTFRQGLEFIKRNQAQDNWFLQIETFDPHEPFVSDRMWKDHYPSQYDPDKLGLFDWPPYGEVTQTPEQIAEAQRNYQALVTKCDHSLGNVLDAFDKYDLWKDTMLIVWTDHGFLLSEHNAWAKNWCPLYEELSHTPFFVWDPRTKQAGEDRHALVQPAIDLGPTLLNYFGLEPTERMRGKDLTPVIASDDPVREAAMFGYHGKALNVTDGRYVYYCDPLSNGSNYVYTLMPTAMRGFKNLNSMAAELAGPMEFTKQTPTLRFDFSGNQAIPPEQVSRVVYDLDHDPAQQNPMTDDALQQRMIDLMMPLLKSYDAPPEIYERFGFTAPAAPSGR